jgi:hypothetical protein
MRCAIPRRPSKKEVDKSFTSDDEFVGKAAAALFTSGWGKVKIRRAHGSSRDEVLPVNGRATTRFHLTALLGRRLDEASCHRWPVAGGALGARHSTRSMEGSSGGGHGMRPRRAPTWRRQPCGRGARLQCSGGTRMTRWEKMAGAVQRSSGSVLLQ